MQAAAEELGHGLLHEFVVDGLFCLVFIGGLRREAVCHQHEAVCHVLKRDLRLVLCIFSRLLDVGVDGVDKGILHSLLWRAAVFQPGGIVVILDAIDLVGEADRRRDLHLVLGLILAVAALALCLPILRHGERLLLRQLPDIVKNALLIAVVRRLEFSGRSFIAEAEGHARVHDGLPLERVLKVRPRHLNVGENIQIGQPVEHGACLFPVGRLLLHLPHKLAALKMERIFEAVAADGHVKIARGVLRGAGAKAVEAQRKFIVAACIVVIFAARVQLAENQLPIVAALLLVPIHRAAASEVLDLDRAVGVARHDHQIAVALARFVDGVG